MSDGLNHVLVVDDEPEVRQLTARALRASGMTCDLASDGEQAFKMVCSRPYNGVLTDLKMPRRHGHALCLDVMKLPSPPSVMVVTALSDARLVRDLMKLGVYDVAQKPVNYDVLAIKVQAMIEFGKAKRPTAPVPPPDPAKAKKKNLLHLVENTLVELTELFGERLDSAFDWHEKLAEPPKAVSDYIRRLAEEEDSEEARPKAVIVPGHETRRTERVTCYTTATAVPVNRDWKRVGEPFKLALRDLSEGGGRLLYTRSINSEYLALSWAATQLVAQRIRVVCRVRRCRPCGPFYDIGGQFVMAD